MKLNCYGLLCIALLLVFLPLEASASGFRGDYRLHYMAADYLKVDRDSTLTGNSVRKATSVVQDLRLVAWPGWEGIDVHTHIRGRWGSNELWPSGDRDTELVDLYVNFTRSRYRLRAGRQTLHGALGVHYLDGLGVQVVAKPWLSIQGWGGWSRGRTLNQDRSGPLLQDTDIWAPREGSTLWSAEVLVRPRRKPISASLQYLRELRTDRSTLYSERLAVSFHGNTGGWFLDGVGTFDLASAETNKLALGFRRPMTPAWDIFGNFQRYRPFFELWTIWGAFSPVAYEEFSGGIDWRRGRLKISGGASYRIYDDTASGLDSFPVEDDGWSLDSAARWIDSSWEGSLSTRVRMGPGSYLSSTDAGFRYRVSEKVSLGAHGTANQRFNEYRLGEGKTLGGGFDATLKWKTVSIRSEVGWYAQEQNDLPGFEDYDQFRGRVLLTYDIGKDPGLSKRPTAGSPKS